MPPHSSVVKIDSKVNRLSKKIPDTLALGPVGLTVKSAGFL